MNGTDDGYLVAYCAPGQRWLAAFTLAVKGEEVARILEHPWLEGMTDVIVVSEPPDFSDVLSLPVRSGNDISDEERRHA